MILAQRVIGTEARRSEELFQPRLRDAQLLRRLAILRDGDTRRFAANRRDLPLQ
jgi:hypothetical protein